MRQKLGIAKRGGKVHNRGMGKVLKIAICANLCNLWLCGGGVNLESLESDGVSNTAVWTNGVFLNLEGTDSRYVVPVDYTGMAGPVLAVTAEVVLNPSNVVSVAFGDEASDSLRLECREGVWEILCGEQRHGFADAIPPPQTGTRTYRIRIAANPWGEGYAPGVTVSVDGGEAMSANHLAPSKQRWDGMANLSRPTHARFALRGKGAGVKSIGWEYSNPGTLIIIR